MKTFIALWLARSIGACLLWLGIVGNGIAQEGPKRQKAFALAERRAPVAQECLIRAKAVLEGWLAIRDPATGMMPRTTKQYVWAPGDNAADMYPFLVLSARFTAPERIDELLALLRTEVSLTTRLDGLPDWYSIRDQRFQHDKPDIDRIIFAATEYAKDGLNPLIELDGPAPWGSRMRQLVDGVIKHSPIESDFGKLPSNSTEVNGELLQVLTRFYFLTGELRYLEFAERIADAYCVEVLPNSGWLPAHRWDFSKHKPIDDVLSLNDHGNEIVGGLAELFSASHGLGRDSSARYELPLRRMFDTLLEKARNEDGLWYSRLRASTAEVLSSSAPDTWGYALAGMLNFGLVTNEPRFMQAAKLALKNIDKERYLEWNGADSFADSIEGALLLIQHLPEPSAYHWLEQILPRFFAKQKLPRDGGTGIVEGWYGDGNYARTALMVALCYSRGTFMLPWNSGLELGGATAGSDDSENVDVQIENQDRLYLSLSSKEDWKGRLYFDHARHADHFRLPRDLPRLNSFPQWFTVDAAKLYRVAFLKDSTVGESTSTLRLGAELLAGLPVDLRAGEKTRIIVVPVGPAPYGKEPEPTDPFELLDAVEGDQALIDSVDLNGGESYFGETYEWTGKGAIEWIAKRTDESNGGSKAKDDSTLWIRWGSKNDPRQAKVTIGEHVQIVEHSGYDGFDWLAIDVPLEWWQGNQLRIRIEALEDGAAFISTMRLRQLGFSPRAEATTRTIEAEDFDGDWRLQDNLPGFSGNGFRVSNADGISTSTLHKTIDLPAGNYQIWARGFEGGNQDRRFAIDFADRHFSATHKRIISNWNELHPRPSATGFSWQLAAHVQWNGGPVTLKIRDAGLGFEVADAILLTTDIEFDPGARERFAATLNTTPSPKDSINELIEQCAASAERAHKHIASQQDTPEDWSKEKQRLKGLLAEALGLSPLPPRTPLNIRKLGILQRDGYSVEKIVFDSRPGFPVTANVYVPAGPGPFPIVLNPVGHWGKSKAEPVVQARCIGLAKQGYLALTYDAFGQGERNVEGNSHSEYFRSILVGQNNMSFMVWDTMRALDYLLQRKDADGSRVACTGASGGGLNTLYAAAIDERIGVAVPVVYLTRFREFLETKITHCPCSHVNGLASIMDMGDVAGLIAPRPLLAITASKDASFTPKGAEAAIKQAQGAFQITHASKNLKLLEFDAPHDYNRKMRESLYGFLAMHLKEADSSAPISEPMHAIEQDPSVLNCYSNGQVPKNSETVQSLCRSIAQQYLSDSNELVGIPSSLNLTNIHRAKFWIPSPPAMGFSRMKEAAGISNVHGQPYTIISDNKTIIPYWYATNRSRQNPTVRGRIAFIGSEYDPSHPVAVAAKRENVDVFFLPMPHKAFPRSQYLSATNSLLLGESALFRKTRTLIGILKMLRTTRLPLICYAENPHAISALLIAGKAMDIADVIILPRQSKVLLEAFNGPTPNPGRFSWEMIRKFSEPINSSKASTLILQPASEDAPKAIAKWISERAGN